MRNVGSDLMQDLRAYECKASLVFVSISTVSVHVADTIMS
jgi:hypothetical protein